MINISTDLGSIYSSMNLRLDTFESNITKAIQGFYKLQTNTEKSSSIMDKSVFTAVSNIERSYNLWDKANEKTGKSLLDNSKKIDSYKQQINLLDKELVKSEKTLEDMIKKNGEASKEVEVYKSHVLDLKEAHQELNSKLKETEKETTTLAGKMKLLGNSFDEIDKKYETFNNIGQKISGIGSKLTMGLTLPLVGAGTAATKLYSDFEHGIGKISTIADTSKISIDELSNGVKNLSSVTGVSTDDLNNALYESISSGVETAKSVDFLNVAVKASKAGFTDTATAVDTLTTILNSYGKTADEATDISNQLLVAQNLGKLTIDDLGASIGKVTPIASALGVTTQELMSSLASTTSQGLNASESITALKAAMSNIVKPTKEASDAAELLGIDFSTSALKSKGWMPFLQDLKEKLKEASPEFANMNDQLEKNSNRLLELEKAGQKGTEEYKSLTKANKGLTKDLELLAQAADSPIGAFATMFGSVEGLNSILMLTSDTGMNIYNESMKQMTENTTALDDAYKKMSDTSTEKFVIQLNKLKLAGIETGNKLMPLAEKGIKFLGDLADKFNSLSPETQEFIVKAGLAAAALGPLTSAIGGTISGVSNLLSVGSKVGTFFNMFKGSTLAVQAVKGVGTAATVAEGVAGGGGLLGLASSFGPLVAAAGPWLIAGAAVAGTGYAIYKGMTEEAVPAVDLFADKLEVTTAKVENSNNIIANSYAGVSNIAQTSSTSMANGYNGVWNATETTTIKISEATQKAVGAYMKMNDDTQKTLNGFYVNSTKITTDTANSLTTKYKDMGAQIKNGMDKNFNEGYAAMQKFFQNSSTLTATEEVKSLEVLKKNNDDKKKGIDEYTKQVQQILQNAANKHRELTSTEQQQINTIQEQMKTTAVKTLSNGEIESKIILERLKDYGTRITAEQASNEIKNANKARDESVKAANEQYDKTVAEIIRMRDETHTITADQADKLIADAKRQKDDSITHADELKEGVVERITNMNRDTANSVDTNTGEILTNWDKLKRWWSGWKPEIKTFHYSVNGTEGTPMGGHIPENASGTNYFEGGFTTMHERGYELYNLPEGSKIYNHQASEALVKETAKQVAESVLANMTYSRGSSEIIVPVILDGREIARVTAPYMDKIQGNNMKLAGRGVGLG